MSRAYYNEIDKFCAQWLRNLIEAGHIAPGDVDERSIEDVRPSDIRGYTQCHFFAGLGAWSYALRLAGWSDDRPVWTSSCPCQPFSAAGEGLGFADERHLWPTQHHLVRFGKPPVVLGEQVASKDANPWIDLVQDDLEALGYAVGAVPFPSAGVGAPHIRDRLYWVADSDSGKRNGLAIVRGFERNREDAGRKKGCCEPSARSQDGGMGNANDQGLAVRSQPEVEPGNLRIKGATLGAAEPVRGFWAGADWIYCTDGKYRPVEPGTFPLAHGAPARVGRLRAYGNTINPWQAAEFIKAYMASTTTRRTKEAA